MSKQIVVVTSTRPRLVVFGGMGIADGFQSACCVVRVYETISTVGVLHGIDDDDSVLQDCCNVRIVVPSNEMIRQCDGGVRRRDFVAMYAVRQPNDGRRRRNQSITLVNGQRSGSEFRHVGLDLVDPGNVLRRTDGGGDQLPSLPRPGVGRHHDPVRRRRRERREPAQCFLGRADLCAGRMAHNGFNGRDRRDRRGRAAGWPPGPDWGGDWARPAGARKGAPARTDAKASAIPRRNLMPEMSDSPRVIRHA